MSENVNDKKNKMVQDFLEEMILLNQTLRDDDKISLGDFDNLLSSRDRNELLERLEQESKKVGYEKYYNSLKDKYNEILMDKAKSSLLNSQYELLDNSNGLFFKSPKIPKYAKEMSDEQLQQMMQKIIPNFATYSGTPEDLDRFYRDENMMSDEGFRRKVFGVNFWGGNERNAKFDLNLDNNFFVNEDDRRKYKDAQKRIMNGIGTSEDEKFITNIDQKDERLNTLKNSVGWFGGDDEFKDYISDIANRGQFQNIDSDGKFSGEDFLQEVLSFNAPRVMGALREGRDPDVLDGAVDAGLLIPRIVLGAPLTALKYGVKGLQYLNNMRKYGKLEADFIRGVQLAKKATDAVNAAEKTKGSIDIAKAVQNASKEEQKAEYLKGLAKKASKYTIPQAADDYYESTWDKIYSDGDVDSIDSKYNLDFGSGVDFVTDNFGEYLAKTFAASMMGGVGDYGAGIMNKNIIDKLPKNVVEWLQKQATLNGEDFSTTLIRMLNTYGRTDDIRGPVLAPVLNVFDRASKSHSNDNQ